MPERSKDWLNQSLRDLESAKSQMSSGFYEWACFISQQAAAKAVKAIYQKLGANAWGHSVSDLLKGLQEKLKVSEELVKNAQQLDKFYIPTRYPDGWVSGMPGEYITKEDAESAISNSGKIIQFCQSFLAK